MSEPACLHLPARYGRGLEVLEPEALRLSLWAFAKQTLRDSSGLP